MKVLRTGIFLVTAGVALVATGPATGGGARTYSAHFESGGSVSFELGRDRDRRVRKARIAGITADCGTKTAELDFTIYGSTPVLDDRSFTLRSEDETGGKAVIRGEFSRRWRRVRGSARVHGRFDFEDGRFSCDSGRQAFVAR